MSNFNWSFFEQLNYNVSDHDASSTALANSGNNAVLGGLIGANVLNPATATAAAVNLSPVSQANVASDISSIIDPDLFIDLL